MNLSIYLTNKLDNITTKPIGKSRNTINDNHRKAFGLYYPRTSKSIEITTKRNNIIKNTNSMKKFKKYVQDNIIDKIAKYNINIDDNNGVITGLIFNFTGKINDDDKNIISNIVKSTFTNNEFLTITNGKDNFKLFNKNIGANIPRRIDQIIENNNMYVDSDGIHEIVYDEEGNPTNEIPKQDEDKHTFIKISTVNDIKTTEIKANDNDNYNCVMQIFDQNKISGMDKIRNNDKFSHLFKKNCDSINKEELKAICNILKLKLKVYTRFGYDVDKPLYTFNTGKKGNKVENKLSIIVSKGHATIADNSLINNVNYVTDITHNNIDINVVNTYVINDKLCAKIYYDINKKMMVMDKTFRPSLYTNNLEDDEVNKYYYCFSNVSLLAKKWIEDNDIKQPHKYFRNLFKLGSDTYTMFRYHSAKHFTRPTFMIDHNRSYNIETCKKNKYYFGFPNDSFEIFRVMPNVKLTDDDFNNISFIIPKNIIFNDKYYYMNAKYKILTTPLYKFLVDEMCCHIEIECIICSTFRDLTNLPIIDNYSDKENKTLQNSIIGHLICGGNNGEYMRTYDGLTLLEKDQIEYECIHENIQFMTKINNDKYTITVKLPSHNKQYWHIYSYIISYSKIAIMQKMKEIIDNYPDTLILGGCVDSIHLNIKFESLYKYDPNFKSELRTIDKNYKYAKLMVKQSKIPKFRPLLIKNINYKVKDLNVISVKYEIYPEDVDDIVIDKKKYNFYDQIYDDNNEVICNIYEHNDNYILVKHFIPPPIHVNDTRYYKCLSGEDYFNMFYDVDTFPTYKKYSQFSLVIGAPGVGKSYSVLSNANQYVSCVLSPTINNRENNKDYLENSYCIQKIRDDDRFLNSLVVSHIYIDEYTRVKHDLFMRVYNYCLDKGLRLTLIGDFNQLSIPKKLGKKIDESYLINKLGFSYHEIERNYEKNRFEQRFYAEYIDSLRYKLGELPTPIKLHSEFQIINKNKFNSILESCGNHSHNTVFICSSNKLINYFNNFIKTKLNFTNIPCRDLINGNLLHVNIDDPSIWWDHNKIDSKPTLDKKYEPCLFITAYKAQSLTLEHENIILMMNELKDNYHALYVSLSRPRRAEQIKLYYN